MTQGVKNDRTRSLALTIRPKNGFKLHHEQLLRQWLNKHAEQWEVYEETKFDDLATRHVHGRVLLKGYLRMDKVKTQICNWFKFERDERLAHYGKPGTDNKGGIGWLYDTWDYARKDLQPLLVNITDEDEWIYADPENKVERKKNMEIKHYLSFIEHDLGPQTDRRIVEDLLMKQIVQDNLQMPGSPTALANLAWKIAQFWNYLQMLADTDTM